MWTTEKTHRAKVSPRPLRVAYLVPLKPSHTLLDVIFDEAMSRWGGRRTPVVKTDGRTISEAEWVFLDLWDADLIYSYVPLQDDLHDRIAYCLAPSNLEIHNVVDDSADSRAYQPVSSQFEWALKSISVLPRMARLQEIRREPIYEVLDKDRDRQIARDLADSFGFLSNSTFDLSLTPYARRLSVRNVGDEKFAKRLCADDTISNISDIGELETRLSNDGRLLFPSQMSDMFCPYLNLLREHGADWEEFLTIVLGDHSEDRLLFWNAIHRYKSLNVFRSNQIFRFDLARFQEGVPDWIRHLCGGKRNYRHLSGNSAPNIRIISSSVEAERLELIAQELGSGRHSMSSSSKLSASDIYEIYRENDPRIKYEHSLNLWPAWNWPTTEIEEIVRLENAEIDLPCVKPWHIQEFPLGPTTVGAWLSDLKIERAEDHSRYSNVIHHWMFPRRLALHNSVQIENYGESRMAFHPPTRPTERGRLSLWDDPQWQRPTLSLPQDIEAFRRALIMHHPNTIAACASHTGKSPYARLEAVKLSDKGRDLLGVLKFFRNLNEAILFLTNQYILSLISKLSPTDPAENPDRISKLKMELVKRLQDPPFNDDDFDRAAKRVLELSARWLQKDSKENEYASYAWLWQHLKETAKDKPERELLDECIKFLRNQNFLFQGFGWRCKRCQHSNWVELSAITNTLECVVCNYPEDAPIGGDANSHFKLNPFVSAAFSPTSAQDSVLWCLSVLLNKAQHSFLLTPTLDIKDKAVIPRGTDLDVLACIDGKVHFYEVKRSFSGIDTRQIEDLIKVSSIIRPDVAGFAIHSNANKEYLKNEDIQNIRQELQNIDVKFVLMLNDEDEGSLFHGDLPRNIGDEMRWSIWSD